MAWKAYEIVFRLRTPLHSGWRKVGNLQMTRPYVTGRMFMSALIMHLTRKEAGGESATNPDAYREMGARIHRTLAVTYFYPALKSESGYEVQWPWEDEAGFRRRFMGSYASTALVYPRQAAAEGSLHEVEFLSPYTRDEGKPVFLKGYIFEKQEEKAPGDWRSVLDRLQLGGERGYGWGRVEWVNRAGKDALGLKEVKGGTLFDGKVHFERSGAVSFSYRDETGKKVPRKSEERPILKVKKESPLLAHTGTEGVSAAGWIEPLVGRGGGTAKQAGQTVKFGGICFAPGSIVEEETEFAVFNHGIWQKSRPLEQ